MTCSLYGYDLGGNCLEKASALLLPPLWDKYEKAIKQKDYEKAIEIRKEIILVGCDNEYFWSELPVLHLKINDFRGAIDALEEMYIVNHFEIVDSFFNPEFKPECGSIYMYRLFAVLKEKDEFKNSTLARQMQKNREQYERRRKQFIRKYKNLNTKEKPPETYIAKGACPFEGCFYGKWKVLKDSFLYDKPNGKTVVGKISKGDQVVAVTGEVYVKPRPIAIIYDVRIHDLVSLKNGDIIFQLDYIGEFAYRYWKDGDVFEADLGVLDYCPFPSRYRFAEYIFPEQERDPQIWWIKLQLSDKVYGWTKESGNFGGNSRFE